MKKRLVSLTVPVVGLWIACSAFAQGPKATIDQLSWMTGSYQSATGLEENWIEAKSGTLASLVRSANDRGTSFIELIIIEEVEGSLVLHIQQWSPAMVPRSEQPNTMDLVSISDNSVSFKSRQEDAGIQTLGYSKPEPDKFVIHIKSARGEFDVPMTKR